jgi:hypothetical protein
VDRKGEIRLGKAREQAVFQHGRRAFAEFFRRLPNQHQRAVPARFVAGQQLRRAIPA